MATRIVTLVEQKPPTFGASSKVCQTTFPRIISRAFKKAPMLFFISTAALLASCSEDEETPTSPQDPYGISGVYVGEYKTVNASADSNDGFLDLHSNLPWQSRSVTIHVSYIGKDSLEMLFTGEWTNRTRGKLTIQSDESIRCNQYTFKDDAISFYEFRNGTYGHGTQGGWISGTSLIAYKTNY